MKIEGANASPNNLNQVAETWQKPRFRNLDLAVEPNLRARGPLTFDTLWSSVGLLFIFQRSSKYISQSLVVK